MTKTMTIALLGLLALAALAAIPNASAATSACAFPNDNQCVCVGAFDCRDTASGERDCPLSYSYDQDYWWGYGCLA